MVDRNNPSPETRTELVTATIRDIYKMQRLSEILEQSAGKHRTCGKNLDTPVY